MGQCSQGGLPASSDLTPVLGVRIRGKEKLSWPLKSASFQHLFTGEEMRTREARLAPGHSGHGAEPGTSFTTGSLSPPPLQQEKDAAFQSLGPGCLYLQDAGSRTGTLERWRENSTAPSSACTLSSAGQEAGAEQAQASACSRGSSALTPPCASLCQGLHLGAGRGRNQGPDLQDVGVTQSVCGPQREVPGSVWHRSHSGPSQSAARGLPEPCPGAEGRHQAMQSQVPGQRAPQPWGQA